MRSDFQIFQIHCIGRKQDKACCCIDASPVGFLVQGVSGLRINVSTMCSLDPEDQKSIGHFSQIKPLTFNLN